MKWPWLVTEVSGTSVKRYYYDRNGNTVRIVETADPDGPGGAEPVEVAREEMTYDALNRMTSWTGPAGSESFTYRGAEWHRFSQTARGETTMFLYDGDDVVADYTGGALAALYVTPFLDQNLSLTKNGAIYYYSQDGLGSVRTLSDLSGAAVNRYDYTAWGEPFAPTTRAAVAQRYTFTGRERNPAGPLMYYRYRQYDLRAGRFESRDPLWGERLQQQIPNGAGLAVSIETPVRLPTESGHLAGCYVYVADGPVLRIDPYGLEFRICSTPIGQCEATGRKQVVGPKYARVEAGPIHKYGPFFVAIFQGATCYCACGYYPEYCCPEEGICCSATGSEWREFRSGYTTNDAMMPHELRQFLYNCALYCLELSCP